MSQFILKINLGNDAMQTGMDMAMALRNVALDMDYRGIVLKVKEYPIMDSNGNTVGTWRVK